MGKKAGDFIIPLLFLYNRINYLTTKCMHDKLKSYYLDHSVVIIVVSGLRLEITLFPLIVLSPILPPYVVLSSPHPHRHVPRREAPQQIKQKRGAPLGAPRSFFSKCPCTRLPPVPSVSPMQSKR